MINWDSFGAATAREKVWMSVRKSISADNYGTGPGKWCLTELITSRDSRKYTILQILDGVNAASERVYGIEPMRGKDGRRIHFKLRVLSRQACCRTADGHKIWKSQQALDENGMDGDILPDFDELPMPGDIVEIKEQMRVLDDETGDRIDGETIQKWALRGERPENYLEFVVDRDLCIDVPYPFALTMLTKHGKNLAQPRFRKLDRSQKTADKKSIRRITNWFFEEEIRNPQKRRRNKADGANQRENPTIATAEVV